MSASDTAGPDSDTTPSKVPATASAHHSSCRRRYVFRAGLALVLALLLCPPVRAWIKVHRVLFDLRRIDGAAAFGESREACRYRVSRETREAMVLLTEPEDFAAFLRISCDELFRYGRDGELGLQDENPFEEAEWIAIEGLVDGGDEQSFECLASAAADPDAHWDGGRALSIASAVTEVGRPCLPYLRRESQGRTGAFVQRLIEAIERGEKY